MRRPRHSRYVLTIVLTIYGAGTAWTETIYLKDGRKIEAKIIEQTDQSVRVDWYGVPVTYWLDEIERIEASGSSVEAPTIAPAEADVPVAPDAPPTVVAHDPDATALITHVLQASGLAQQLDQLAAQSGAQFDERVKSDERFAKLSPAQREHIRQVMAEAFQKGTLLQSMMSAFTERFDREKLQQVVEWLGSPLAKRMTALEEAHPDPEAAREFMAALQQSPPPEGRLALVRRLDEAVGFTESALAMALGVMATAGQTLQASGRVSADEVQAEMAKVRQQFQAQYRDLIRANVLARLLFTYRAAPDDELEQYVAYWESPTGRWFSRLAIDALTRAETQAFEVMMRRFTELAGQPT